MCELAKSEEPNRSGYVAEHEKKQQMGRKKYIKEIDVNYLFEGQREVSLLHREEIYRLRITANGKLILTK